MSKLHKNTVGTVKAIGLKTNACDLVPAKNLIPTMLKPGQDLDADTFVVKLDRKHFIQG